LAGEGIEDFAQLRGIPCGSPSPAPWTTWHHSEMIMRLVMLVVMVVMIMIIIMVMMVMMMTIMTVMIMNPK
jgi:ABC-type Na+ efflux pump permease subunit